MLELEQSPERTPLDLAPVTTRRMNVTIERIETRGDARGAVFEPLAADGLARQRNVHVVISEPGAVRGNHYHERGREILTVVGPALVRYRDGSLPIDTRVPAGQVYRFTIPPGVAHAVQNTGDTAGLLIAFHEIEHDPATPDAISDILIPPPGED